MLFARRILILFAIAQGAVAAILVTIIVSRGPGPIAVSSALAPNPSRDRNANVDQDTPAAIRKAADPETDSPTLAARVLAVNPAAALGRDAFIANAVESLADSEFQGAVVEEVALTFDRAYADLFRRWQLPSQRLDELRQLLGARFLDTFGAVATMASYNGANVNQVSDAAETASDIAEAKICALLGEEKYAELGSFESTLKYRNLLRDTRDFLAGTKDAIDLAQVDQFVVAMQGTSEPAVDGLRRAIPAMLPVTSTTLDDYGLAVAQGILSPTQYRVLLEQNAQAKARRNVSGAPLHHVLRRFSQRRS